MTNEDMERSIEFLLNSQASLESQMERTNRQVEQLSRQVEQLSRQVEQMSKRLEDYAETQSEFMQVVLRHIEAQGEINNSFRRAINDLAGAQQRTEERLTSFIETVDRYISEGRNGKA